MQLLLPRTRSCKEERKNKKRKGRLEFYLNASESTIIIG